MDPQTDPNEVRLIVNFGGPRDLDEVESFLKELLTDRDVVRTRLPRWFFRYIAARRTEKVRHDYAEIGGKSPIYGDTEAVAKQVGALTFHRYLPATHAAFVEQIEKLSCPIIRIFPMFPQFSYATSGSIARWFANNLSPRTVRKLKWIPSYASHPAYLKALIATVRHFLEQKNIPEDQTLLVCSAHGLPVTFIRDGDSYQSECEETFAALRAAFPNAHCHLSYQSKFGRGKWLEPSTETLCQTVDIASAKYAVIVPLSFTSDHIETLFEIEQQYVPLLKERGLDAYRCPALNLDSEWLAAIEKILATRDTVCNRCLIFEQNRYAK